MKTTLKVISCAVLLFGVFLFSSLGLPAISFLWSGIDNEVYSSKKPFDVATAKLAIMTFGMSVLGFLSWLFTMFPKKKNT